MAAVSLFVSSSTSAVSTERRFQPDIEVSELKNKLELVIGTAAVYQVLQLKTEDNVLVTTLEDDSRTLGSYGAASGMKLYVVDKDPNATAAKLDDVSQVEKVEMKDDEYDKRDDSVRAFKRRMKLGRFADGEDGAELSDIIAEDRQLTDNMKVGDRCRVEKPTRHGSIAFIGETQFKPGCMWIGVKLDLPLGKNNGSVNGVKYFECGDKYGVFQRPKLVTVGDFPEEGGLDDEEL